MIPGFPIEFKKVARNYGNKKNFARLVHRELKKITLEEVMMQNPSLIKIVQLSRLFMKANKQEMEDVKTLVAELMQTDALYVAICERKNLNKWDLDLTIQEEDKEILRRVKFYLASKETGKKTGIVPVFFCIIKNVYVFYFKYFKKYFIIDIIKQI